jgi:acyl dehydratase
MRSRLSALLDRADGEAGDEAVKEEIVEDRQRYAGSQVYDASGAVVFFPSVDAAEGIFFEDLQLGQEFTSPGRTVTEADIVIFAGLSGDYNVLHTDAEHMKASIFGERIAHGLLGLSIQHGLAARGEPAAAHGLLSGLKWKFKGPIKIGDTVHVLSRRKP